MALFDSNTAREAGAKGKRGASLATVILTEWREGNKENGLALLNLHMTKALDGDIDSAKIILPYYFGKPKETLEIQSGEEGNEFVIRVVNSKSEIQTK